MPRALNVVHVRGFHAVNRCAVNERPRLCRPRMPRPVVFRLFSTMRATCSSPVRRRIRTPRGGFSLPGGPLFRPVSRRAATRCLQRGESSPTRDGAPPQGATPARGHLSVPFPTRPTPVSWLPDAKHGLATGVMTPSNGGDDPLQRGWNQSGCTFRRLFAGGCPARLLAAALRPPFAPARMASPACRIASRSRA